MALTNFARLTNEQLTMWKKDVWKAARNRMFISNFLGDDNMSMIQRIPELTQSEKGARAVITLVADLEGDGVAGDRTLEGNEEALVSREQVIQIDQLRQANRSEGRLAEQRSVVYFRENARDVLAYWLADRHDQLAFLTLSGVSYAKTNRGADRVGSDFVNLAYSADVTAPTSNRHFRWSVDAGRLMPGDTSMVTADDFPTWNMLVDAKAEAKNRYIRPIMNDDMHGMELYHVFMTPSGFARLKRDPDFQTAYRQAMPRSQDNILFKGMTTGLYIDGLMLHEYRHVYNTVGASAGEKWGAANNVNGQRVLLCGAQALGFADIGDPYWVEKYFDYENQPGISVGKMCGLKKPVFYSQESRTNEDFGLMVIDTAI